MRQSIIWITQEDRKYRDVAQRGPPIYFILFYQQIKTKDFYEKTDVDPDIRSLR